MTSKWLFFLLVALCVATQSHAQSGNLFIIGGGKRPPELLKAMVAAARLKPSDYVAVLPMSSAEPDSSYYYFRKDLQSVCSNPILNLHFTAAQVQSKSRLDSLQHARLIFITGGDQDRFMQVVSGTPVTEAIHRAFRNGATIAGTSAGAAVMSEHMITGRELIGDTTIRATFRKIQDKNLEIKPGLGLVTKAVIDQHFIIRSRYNRLISALARYPQLACIGIDEATAILVSGNRVKVVGESQVVVIRKPQQLQVTKKGLIKVQDLQFSLYTDGDEFTF